MAVTAVMLAIIMAVMLVMITTALFIMALAMARGLLIHMIMILMPKPPGLVMVDMEDTFLHFKTFVGNKRVPKEILSD